MFNLLIYPGARTGLATEGRPTGLRPAGRACLWAIFISPRFANKVGRRPFPLARRAHPRAAEDVPVEFWQKGLTIYYAIKSSITTNTYFFFCYNEASK